MEKIGRREKDLCQWMDCIGGREEGDDSKVNGCNNSAGGRAGLRGGCKSGRTPALKIWKSGSTSASARTEAAYVKGEKRRTFGPSSVVAPEA